MSSFRNRCISFEFVLEYDTKEDMDNLELQCFLNVRMMRV